MKITKKEIMVALKVMKMMEEKDVKIVDWDSDSVEVNHGGDRRWQSDDGAAKDLFAILN